MHEMNVIGNLAASVVQWGQANRVRKILEIDITCAEGAKLVLSVRPIGYHCNACGSDYEMTPREWLDMDINRAACVHCDSEDIVLTSGGEYFISDILAETEEDAPSDSMGGS